MKNNFVKTTLFILVFCLFLSASVLVGAKAPLLADNANLLTDEEIEEISSLLQEISERQQYDVVAVTVDSLDGEDIVEFAKHHYTSMGYGYGDEKSGTMLLVAMKEREYALISHGEGMDIIPDESAISDEFLFRLKTNSYASAFRAFAKSADERITEARNPEEANENKEFPWANAIAISLAVGLVSALITTSVMKSKLKTVRYRNYAREYVRRGSFNLAHSRDLYLYSTVTRAPKPKPNNNGGKGNSFRGGSFSGSRGKF